MKWEVRMRGDSSALQKVVEREGDISGIVERKERMGENSVQMNDLKIRDV
jgi:hypothetical protein